jgi:hypothetical protein
MQGVICSSEFDHLLFLKRVDFPIIRGPLWLSTTLLKVNTSFPLPDLPNQPMDCYQIIGEDEAPLGDAT